MLSEEVNLGQFGKDRLATMSQAQLEDGIARAKRAIANQKETQRRLLEEEGSLLGDSALTSLWYYTVSFYEIELALRERRALNEDRLTLLKELRKVRREKEYDRDDFPDRREIVIEEILNEQGGYSLAFRRYERGIRPSGKLWEKRQAEKLKRRLEVWRQVLDKARPGSSAEPQR